MVTGCFSITWHDLLVKEFEVFSHISPGRRPEREEADSSRSTRLRGVFLRQPVHHVLQTVLPPLRSSRLRGRYARFSLKFLAAAADG
jgi:hypothetical protein